MCFKIIIEKNLKIIFLMIKIKDKCYVKVESKFLT